MSLCWQFIDLHFFPWWGSKRTLEKEKERWSNRIFPTLFHPPFLSFFFLPLLLLPLGFPKDLCKLTTSMLFFRPPLFLSFFLSLEIVRFWGLAANDSEKTFAHEHFIARISSSWERNATFISRHQFLINSFFLLFLFRRFIREGGERQDENDGQLTANSNKKRESEQLVTGDCPSILLQCHQKPTEKGWPTIDGQSMDLLLIPLTATHPPTRQRWKEKKTTTRYDD